MVVGADVHDSPSDTGCQTAYEDFVFQTFTTLEQSPFFTPIAGQQHAPVMRLSSGYAVNPLYWFVSTTPLTRHAMHHTRVSPLLL